MPQFPIDQSLDLPVIVIGAGAAGIIAAWRSASLGVPTILLEKTNRIGTKILISGGGKCNITHDGPLEEVLRAFRPNEARFIRPACYRFQNHEIVEMLTSRGLEVYTRPDGRIFPTTGTAKDVVAILRDYLREAGVDVRLQTPVRSIRCSPSPPVGDRGSGGEGPSAESVKALVQTDQGPLRAKALVIATGGSSYPNSGTTGDAWPWAKELGHTIVKIRAALAPMTLANVDPEKSGVALRDCILKARQDKEIARWRDDLLFTHRGISGPTALGVSREVAEAMPDGEVTLEVDILPDKPFEAVSQSIVDWTRDNPRKRIGGCLDDFVPKSLGDDILRDAGIPPETIGSNLTQKSRNRLVETLKGWNLGPVKEVVLDKGEVVAGGISLEEVDPQTMESRIRPGLYLCGEALDIAGPVGGYNLQAAFATGYVAGESAAIREGERNF
jgi:predicted Rossmann fold flavoprotein